MFTRTLEEMDDLVTGLKSYVDNYNRFKSSDNPSWPYQAKLSQNELDKRKGDYDLIARDL